MGICVGKPAKTAHASSNQFFETNKLPSNGKNESTSKHQTSSSEAFISSDLKSFSISDLKAATKNFRPDSLVGEGGFGLVFKGWIDENTYAPSKPGTGMVVAVKKLKAESTQGHREWLTEVMFLGKLHHKNLVKLIGYCSESENRLLVYEFMPKGCLENHLFKKGVQPLSWPARIRIAIDVAQGLAFLHNIDDNIIYRDLKAANILLDSDLNAKLSDFGLARKGPTGDNTHVSTRVVGTEGYAAPEYVSTGHLTTKSDVYSFGVVLLELLSGRRAMADERDGGIEETLVEWVKPFLSDNRRTLRIMDIRLGGQYSKKGAQAVAAVALKCLRTDPKDRPPMTEIVAALEEIHNASKDVPRILTEAMLEQHGNVRLPYPHKPKIEAKNSR